MIAVRPAEPKSSLAHRGPMAGSEARMCHEAKKARECGRRVSIKGKKVIVRTGSGFTKLICVSVIDDGVKLGLVPRDYGVVIAPAVMSFQIFVRQYADRLPSQLFRTTRLIESDFA